MKAFQRDEVEDRAAWEREVAALRAEAREPERRLIALGQLGDLLRIGGDGEEAVWVLTEALTLSREQEDEGRTRANTIRLATALQYGGAHDRARTMLEGLVERIEGSTDPAHFDYAIQHLGKIYAEQGRWSDAVECFEGALELRQGRTTEASSRRALDEARQRQAEGA
jgi:lipopolysaccharide biosynthesis regulator YciM